MSAYKEAFHAWQRKYFGDLLTWTKGNVNEVSRMCGVPRFTLYNHFKRAGINPKEFKKNGTVDRTAKP